MRRRDARVRHDADARSFRARSVLRACCLAMAGFCATFVVEGLLRGFGVPHAWMIFAIGSLAAAGLAPRAPWVGVGVVVLLTGAQVVSFLAAPSVSAQRMVEAALSRELGWDMTMPYTRWVTLMPRAGIVALGLVALGFVVVARRDLAAASWRELVAGHPTRRRTYLLLVGAGMVIGTASPLSAWAGYRIERREEKAAARKREDLLAALRSAFVDAWNTADVQGIAACYPEDERISRGEALPDYLREHGLDSWPEIEFARESGDEGERRVFFRRAGTGGEEILMTEWELRGPRWVLLGVRARTR